MAELRGRAARRTNREQDIDVVLRTPGQRGIIQLSSSSRRAAHKILPMLKPSADATHRAMHTKREREKTGQKVRRLVVNFKSRIQAAHISLSKTASEDSKWMRILGRWVERARQIEDELTKYETVGDALKQREMELAVAIEENQKLARELRQSIQKMETSRESWAAVRWTTDNSGAVGRGPPGHIATSPFSLYDPPFERQDLARLLDDAGKKGPQ
jgi:hypothetical protein